MNKEDMNKTVEEMLESMGFSDTKVEVSIEDEYLRVDITSLPEQSGVLIGHHGEGIDALQLIINLMLNNQSEQWQRVLVNVNDYRESRKEIIESMASKAAEDAKSTGKEVVLNYLPSHERRLAHMHLDKDESIHTYSQGEAKYRRLVVAPNLQE